ncbi:corrinoid/iron-sulfur protein large subunit [bacterium BMS3Bbin09]|nr:corrinoid/iron-sulfur protein large subunit [bacterium BMS3Bbin09]
MKYLDLYKLLNKSNCRECGLLTCMAFAHAVINGEKKIEDCPYIDKETMPELGKKIVARDIEHEYDAAVEPLREAMSGLNFSALVDRLGATLSGDRLCVNCLGKKFLVDTKGNVESICHIHLWVTVPLLKYIITGGGPGLLGKWISFDELDRGITMSSYFERRCVEPLKQMADSHTDIFFDLLDIFGGRQPAGDFSADRSRIVHPLPRVPFLFLYWKAEDHFESKLKILFDSSADKYLDFEAVYVLSRGMVEMFKKIIANHEEVMPNLLAM